MKNLGVYIQVPFCQTKCTYCNFHTGVVQGTRFAPYVDAVCREIREYQKFYRAAGLHAGDVDRFVVDTAYIGGGTPSLLAPEHLARMLAAVRERFTAKLEEVTLEADPETIAEEKAVAWAEAGITRISFGVQSFADEELMASGRMHRRADVYRAAEILRAAGLTNLSFDLIAGLPRQTRESWKQSVDEALALAPEHISIYLLEVDAGSRLGKELLAGGPRYSAGKVPPEDEMAESYEWACEELARVGYHHYEISNWARPGSESKHNLKYWRREPYFGFGAGAHSFSGAQRWANAHDARVYVTAIEEGRLPIEQVQTLTCAEALDEELFLGLRQLDGIDVAKIEQTYGTTLDAKLRPLAERGLLEREGRVFRLAPARLIVSNEVFVELLN